MTLLSENSCFVNKGGRFFQILWPSHNVLTLFYFAWIWSLIEFNPDSIEIKSSQFVWENKTRYSISLTLVFFFVTISFSLQIINCRKPRAKKHPSLNGYCKFKIAVEAGCQKPQGLSRTCPHPFCIGSMYVQCTYTLSNYTC